MAKSRVQKTTNRQPQKPHTERQANQAEKLLAKSTTPIKKKDLTHCQKKEMMRKGYKQKETLSKHHPYLWHESKISNHSKNY